MSVDEQWYQALLSHDARFDGRVFVGVVTTGIYCRPICPVTPAKFENTRFFACAAAAEAAGFRPCRRCRPETAPGTPAWLGTSAVVSRALRLIAENGFGDDTIDQLAARLGVGGRHLRRLFATHLGASPAEIARARRVHFARTLIDQSDLPMTELAFSAGFSSIRQFNHAIRTTFGRSPSELRRRRRASEAAPRVRQPHRAAATDLATTAEMAWWLQASAPAAAPFKTAASCAGGGLTLRLPYRPPLDWAALLRFLSPRCIPGVEAIAGNVYCRTIFLHGAPGVIEVSPAAGASHLLMRAQLGSYGGLMQVVERVRRLFDLDADRWQITHHLRRSPELVPLVDAAPGLRVPGAWDGFELAVRAILGQQVTVRGATTLTGRLVQAFGTPVDGCGVGLTHRFPAPEQLAEADVCVIGIPKARAETIRALATCVCAGELVFGTSNGLDDAVARLCAIPGIGPWTAHYIAMRAFGEPDAFPASDLGLRRALGNGNGPVSATRLAQAAEAWRPWRAYAAMHLWMAGGAPHVPPVLSFPQSLSGHPRPAAPGRPLKDCGHDSPEDSTSSKERSES